MQRAVIIDAELELGVGNDDAARARVFGRLRIDRQRRVADLLRQIGADALLDFDVADVLVVLAIRRLVGRRASRLRRLVESGRASVRERCLQYVELSSVAVYFK